jgi:hypothetical protein
VTCYGPITTGREEDVKKNPWGAREDVGNTKRKKSYRGESDCPLRASEGLDIIVG